MQRITNHPLILLIVVVIATAGIMFFSFFPDKLPSLPSQPSTNTGTLPNPPAGKNVVVAFTRRPDYLLTLQDPEGLSQIFDFLKVWGKTYEGQNTKPLKSIIIFLADQPQKNQEKDPQGTSSFSYTLDYTEDSVMMTIFLPNDMLIHPSSSAFFGASVVYIAAKMSGASDQIPNIPDGSRIANFFKLEKLNLPSTQPSRLDTTSPTPLP